MKFNQTIIIKRWKPILEEYEKIQNKTTPRSFRLAKDLCMAHHISNKELRRYYRRWQEGKREDALLFPSPQWSKTRYEKNT